jgi:aminoglycoside phosphotransferase (APT) family kinase protein
MQVIHSLEAPWFGYPRTDAGQYSVWGDYLAAKFQQTLAELKALQIRMQPGVVELAQDYFEQHLPVLQHGQPRVVHSDLTFLNLLVQDGRLAAVLDFEYAMQAPPDYELWPLEAFCLYPNDWAEEGNEIYCAADFASLIPLIRKHYPALFEVPDLRERVNLYQIDAALGSFLGWRKANLSSISPERMNGRDSYMARISNFIFGHGARMF